jgi:2-dehydro-3-deoxyphosphooctonate aldolase (KDO 8-P synthase)
MTQHHIPLANFRIGNDLPFVLLAGPCAMESRGHAMDMSGALKEMTQALGIPLIYKTSYDKANRTSIKSGRGVGLEKGLPILADIRKQMNLPVVTDIHTAEQCSEVAEVVDVLQIPAFLSRQTDLLVAAAQTGRIINVKKGQFLAPWDMKNVAAKITESGNPNVMLCERGVTFGYNTLVNDMRALPVMAETGHPVVFDATHSVQQPGGAGTSTSGDRRMVPYLARAAIAVGVAAVFIETHQDPDCAPSDGPNMMKLSDMPALLEQLLQIDQLVKRDSYKKAIIAKTQAA